MVNVLVMRGARVGQLDHDGRTALDVATVHGDQLFKAAVRLAMETPAADVAFGPAEFDIVSETSSLTDERELTAQIIGEVFNLSDATAQQLDDVVAGLEAHGTRNNGLRLGQEGAARKGERGERELELQLRAEADFVRSDWGKPPWEQIASVIQGAKID